MIGQTVSHYRIIEKLGQGGMGEVYRAEDTTLSRHVAIKVLPDEFSHDPERLAHFEREAKVLASLNHPNIAAIHGLEQADEKRLSLAVIRTMLIPLTFPVMRPETSAHDPAHSAAALSGSDRPQAAV